MTKLVLPTISSMKFFKAFQSGDYHEVVKQANEFAYNMVVDTASSPQLQKDIIQSYTGTLFSETKNLNTK